MKKLAVVLIAMGSLLAGCVVDPGYGYRDDRVYRDDRYRDRDRDGIPNRVDRDRDGDGVRNRVDRAPNDPRRY